MGGDVLAASILENNSISILGNASMIFAGTYSDKYAPDKLSRAGWGTIIQKNNMNVINTISLPTVWTFREPDETPYLFTKFQS